MGARVDKAIDIVKFIMSLFIVGIHSHIYYVIPDGIGRFVVQSVILRLAVPFFFVVSGYYLGIKIWNQPYVERKKSIIGYINNLLVPYLFWSTINLLLYLPVIYDTCESGLEFIAKIIRQVIFYPVGAMWFVLACMVGACIIHVFWENKKVALVFAMFMYGVALLGNNYYFILSNTKYIDFMLKFIISTRNGLFVGFPFMLLGALLAKPEMINNFKSKYVCLLLVLAFILTSVETYTIYNRPYNDDRGLFVSYLLLIPCLVIALLKTQTPIGISTIRLRKYSTMLYFSHRFIISITTMIVPNMPVVILFLVTLLCGLGLYVGLEKVNFRTKTSS